MPLRGILLQLWRRLTQPMPSVQDPEERLQARWLASLLLVALPLAVVFAAMPSLILPDSTVLEDGDFQVVVASLVLWVAVYALSRTGHHQLAAALTIGITSAILFAIAIVDFYIFELNYLLMPILFGSLVLPWRVMLVYIAFNLAGLFVLSGFLPDLTLTSLILEPVSFVGIGSALALLLAHQRTRLAEHRRARLVESEERYRTLFESSADAIALVGVDGTLLDCNPATAEIAGRPREELVGRPFAELGVVPVDDLPGYTRLLARAQLALAPGYLEVEATRSDGTRRWLEAFTTPVAKNGKVDAIQVIAHDISDRRQAEEALRQSEERFRSVVEQSTDGIIVADEQGRIIEWNEAISGISGQRREDVLGRDLSDVVLSLSREERRTPGFRQFHSAAVRAAQATGLRDMVGRVTELDLHRPDGTHRTVLQSIFPIATAEGFLIGSIVRDITDRKRAEAKLRENEERLRLIVEGTDALLMNVDPRGRVTYINEAAATKLGRPAEDIVGQLYLRFVHPDDVERVSRVYQEQSTTGTPSVSLELRVISAGGEVRWYNFVTHPIFKGGKIVEIAALALDITERKRMAEQLARQERLAAVGQLAAGIAHDFRNLLSTILLYAEMDIGQPDLPPRASRHLQIITEEAQRATELVQQMLDFSRRARIKPQPLDLSALAEGLLGVLERTIPAHIHLALDVDRSDPSAFTVEADAGRIQQALTNLVLNARDAMPEGGDLRITLSRVRVSAEERPPVAEMTPGDWVCLAIHDTGMGMSEEVQAHLFEPFFTTKEVHEGTGLGLAQVYGIVRQHQGHIGVETEPGQGTTFSIYLPANGRGGEEQPEDAAVSDPLQGRGETVLLVEDQARLREAGAALLESLGYRVVTAGTGHEALAKCEALRSSEGQSQPVHLVVTDLVMPDLGGEDLLRELQKTMPGVRVLAVTGYSLQGDSVAALRNAGFLDVIFKPVDVDGLGRAVRRALDG